MVSENKTSESVIKWQIWSRNMEKFNMGNKKLKILFFAKNSLFSSAPPVFLAQFFDVNRFSKMKILQHFSKIFSVKLCNFIES
jgi:hypothetical protein